MAGMYCSRNGLERRKLTDLGIPLSLALPAAAASLAYLNAKTSFVYDAEMLAAFIATSRAFPRLSKEDRVNKFYQLESNALDSTTAKRPFLANAPQLPKDITDDDLNSLRTEELTYREAYDSILKYAEWLKQEHGIKKDDIVALDFKNRIEFVLIWYAIWSLGARPAFINTSLRSDALIHCVKTSSSKLLVIDGELTAALTRDVQSRLQDLRVNAAVVDRALEQRIGTLKGLRVANSERSVKKGTEMALLIFTSGTTVGHQSS
jgi:hypothetical protein